jgi:hypothetical protein
MSRNEDFTYPASTHPNSPKNTKKPGRNQSPKIIHPLAGRNQHCARSPISGLRKNGIVEPRSGEEGCKVGGEKCEFCFRREGDEVSDDGVFVKGLTQNISGGLYAL